MDFRKYLLFGRKTSIDDAKHVFNVTVGVAVLRAGPRRNDRAEFFNAMTLTFRELIDFNFPWRDLVDKFKPFRLVSSPLLTILLASGFHEIAGTLAQWISHE